MKGKVKWWNDSRGFGFILGEDDRDYFVHFSNLVGEPRTATLFEDEEVIFEPTNTIKGAIASDVVRLNNNAKNRKPVFKKVMVETTVAHCPCCNTKLKEVTDPNAKAMMSYMCPKCTYKY